MKSPGQKRLALRLAVLAVAMFGFGFLLVPLYTVMCKVVGIGGKPNTVPATVTDARPDLSRLVTVEFVTVLNEQAPWEFRPNVASMKVHPGELYDTTFFARNLTDGVLVATAVPSIAPGQAAQHFIKTQCFCFTEQDFTPHQGRDMGVQFMVDRNLPAYIDHITLSYTFYVNHQATAKLAAETAKAGGGRT
ncbi:MAG: cytochrome c oxidase assembly protein [Gammaproteobacteria bacterium PRO9]|nr:cytochrome c oxidase assembly protein [Gammaproteobacteria bacterium PRO9]